MPGFMISGLIVGLIFGIVVVWQGAGAAGLVLLFSLIGGLISCVVWVGWRVSTGQLDLQTLRALVEVIFSNRSR